MCEVMPTVADNRPVHVSEGRLQVVTRIDENEERE
jgi:hypothetical protein